MKKAILLVTSALLFSVTAQAEVKDCDELKSEIETKIENNGVEDFDVIVVENDEVNDHEGFKVVGSCEGGSHKVLYKNNYKA